jgi:hypothetical protein
VSLPPAINVTVIQRLTSAIGIQRVNPGADDNRQGCFHLTQPLRALFWVAPFFRITTASLAE